ncbi:HupE/UreJ family protein [Pelagibacteraceae bacterium]|nr:HupE/UreJ family protein [Pelagibacteraceae bacterium]
MKKILLFSLILITISKFSYAHYFSESYSNWIISDNKVSATFTILKLEATRVLQIDKFQEIGQEKQLSEGEVFLEYFKPRISALESSKECLLDNEPSLINGKDEYHTIELSYLCASTNSIKIINNVLFDIAQSHVHLSRISINDQILEKALFYNDQTIFINDLKTKKEKSFVDSLTNFISTGMNHILTGFDHLIFLMGLIILVNNFKHLLIVITGFTLGHSITLALVALNIVVPNTLMIEALIGFTILFIAAEYMMKEEKNFIPIIAILLSILTFAAISSLFLQISMTLISFMALILITIGYFGILRNLENKGSFRVIITSLFGVIHGFGFGTFLFNSEFDQTNIISALFGFNLGVEIGQIIFLMIFILLNLSLIKLLKSKNYQYLMQTLMIIVSSLGFYWFIQRLYF